MGARTETSPDDSSRVVNAPRLPGLTFRRFRGASDCPQMVAVFNASNAADQVEWVATVDDFARQYANLTRSDPARDVLIVECDGRIVGYSRVERWDDGDNTPTYVQASHLLPQWRGQGIERAVLGHNEQRAWERAGLDAPDGACFVGAFARNTVPAQADLLRHEGYTLVWHDDLMVRPHLDAIPEVPLPDGIEVRPVQPDQYRAIWVAEVEAFGGPAAVAALDERAFERWRSEPHFQPERWQVAWAEREVAGMIRNFINEDENVAYGRQRGYTEHISVRQPWRRRGLARALLAGSLRLHRDWGMTEAALGVNSANPTSAGRLYESLGFQIVLRQSFYRKDLASSQSAGALLPSTMTVRDGAPLKAAIHGALGSPVRAQAGHSGAKPK